MSRSDGAAGGVQGGGMPRRPRLLGVAAGNGKKSYFQL